MADGKLSTYRSMRDFTKTAEPSGERAIAPSHQLRFVIQKHDATRLHFDLRLELDGEKVTKEERLLHNMKERIRDVRAGPDGALWLLTDSSDGKLLRPTPGE